MEQRRATAHHQRAVAGVDDGQSAGAIGEQLDRLASDAEVPRLRVVARGGEHRSPQRELDLLLDRAVSRRRLADRIPGIELNRMSHEALSCG